MNIRIFAVGFVLAAFGLAAPVIASPTSLGATAGSGYASQTNAQAVPQRKKFFLNCMKALHSAPVSPCNRVVVHAEKSPKNPGKEGGQPTGNGHADQPRSADQARKKAASGGDWYDPRSEQRAFQAVDEAIKRMKDSQKCSKPHCGKDQR